MKSVLRQLDRWRFRERLVRLAWGGARWAAVVGTVLAAACALDWLVDRYSGSKGWRQLLQSTRVLAPSDPLSVGETPFGLRAAMTAGQLALAGVLGYLLVVRPWLRTPPVDDLAFRAEKAFPAFDHRLVTALQLNRPAAKTRGMSGALIREVTREAGEIAGRHDLLSLVGYRRVGWAAAAVAPVLAVWGLFAATDPALAGILVKRQALLPVEIPRRTHLTNLTPGVQPTGAEVVVRFEATGEFSPESVGTLRVVPVSRRAEKNRDGTPVTDAAGDPVTADEVQPEEFYDLTNEKAADGSPTPFFSVRLPPASLDFSFQARLEGGRTREPGRVRFEAPPQLGKDDPKDPPLRAAQILPDYLGRDPDGDPYVRLSGGWDRGEVVDALPQSRVRVVARFNKPVRAARLVPVERVPGKRPGEAVERDRDPVAPAEVKTDRRTAAFEFPTTPRTIGYRLELVDDLDFTNPVQIRRNVRMWDDRPPAVERKKESTRTPDPAAVEEQKHPKDYEWDMALAPNGVIQVTYAARSEVGVRAANIRYRVLPRGVPLDALYSKEELKIQHPQDDPELRVFDRLPLTRYVPDPGAEDPGPFVPDLGLFAHSFRGVPAALRNRVNVEFYPFPSPNPADEPGEVAAGGRRNFEVAGLLKWVPDVREGRQIGLVRRPIEVGDKVEVYVEVYDKLPTVDKDGKPLLGADGNPLPPRKPGYTKGAWQKTVVTEAEAFALLRDRDEAQRRLRDKLADLAKDQAEVARQNPPK